MAVRFETASGLRLFATDRRLRLGDYGALEFLDPVTIQPQGIYCVELLFENKTIAKHYRLHNSKLHFSLSHFKIVPKSLFIFDAPFDAKDCYSARMAIVTWDPYWESVFYSPNKILYAGG
jgi:hypothetical protein